MAIKKTELYSTLWQSCDELRGGMDASQYKDYVLILLFVKYVSDKYAGRKDAQIEVPTGASFRDMVALKGNPEIGEKINKILSKLAEANGLQGVINLTDFNDEEKLGKGKEMVDRLTKLVGLFDNPGLDFSGNRAEGDDLLGDAYEFLMRNFATQSGKSKGSFLTPAEVSRVLAKVVGVRTTTDQAQTIYDPTCGSGSLLLKAHDEAKSATGFDLAIYGQERDIATAGLARMNMILHECATAEIAKDNTLSSPQFKLPNGQLKTFDFAVANPPFSDKAWRNGINPLPEHDLYRRFEFGVPPNKNGDYAFLLHLLSSLKSTGKGAIILPHGVLFRGNAEADIRRNLLQRGYIKGIIGLPANLFYGTGIPACILVLDKEHAQARKGIFMIDASKGFVKDGNKNRLRDQDIHKIVDTFNRQAETARYSRMVPLAEIADPKNDFNLNLPRYIDSSEPEDLQDIEGHLKGGIPQRDLDALEAQWKVFPSLRKELIGPADRPGYAQVKVPVADLKKAVFGNAEFQAFLQKVMGAFESWRANHQTALEALKLHDRPKALIETLSEDLLKAFEPISLVDAYDVYQHLMTYWANTMQDDVYLLVAEGWKGAAKLRPMIEDKDAKSKEKPDLKISDRLEIWNPGFLPPSLTLAKLRQPHGSVPANPLLAEPLYLAKYIERMGTGTRDMIRRCQEAGLPEPEFAMSDGFVITLHRRPETAGVVTGEVTGVVTGEVAGEVQRLLLVFHGEMKRTELQQALGLKHEDNFRDVYLLPAMEAGAVEMTIPDKPNSSKQRYRLGPPTVEARVLFSSSSRRVRASLGFWMSRTLQTSTARNHGVLSRTTTRTFWFVKEKVMRAEVGPVGWLVVLRLLFMGMLLGWGAVGWMRVTGTGQEVGLAGCLRGQLVGGDGDLPFLHVDLEVLRPDDDPVADAVGPESALRDLLAQGADAALGDVGRVLEGGAPGWGGG
jgi:type I restriction enzyme M protein